MKITTPLLGLFLSGGLSYASTLAVYQDNTFYNYTSSTPFIGFTKGITVKCDGNTISTDTMENCPTEQRLCQEVEVIEGLKQKVSIVDATSKVLEKFLSLPQPTVIDAASWIDSAKLIGTEQAALSKDKQEHIEKLKQQELLFRKQAPSFKALKHTKSCEKELELTLPRGWVSFSTAYEANIDEKEVSVTQKLSIINRSGVDIEADAAMFYYRSANQYVRPIHFSPWIVKKYEPKPPRKYKNAMAKSAPMMERAMMADSVQVMSSPMPTVSYEDAREYKITNLTLPSSGVPLDVTVLSWKSALECELKAFPYVNRQAFNVCSFTPKYQIDANNWKVKSGSKIINEHAVGQYRDGKYNLYTKIEEDIKILRKPIVKKERETGIFGGTARKKDGFTLNVTNKSDKIKTLTVIERIPTSTTEEITVKLLDVKSAKKVNYTMLKEGKVEIKLTVGANENKTIDVLFEISYDKDLKVNY